MRRLLFLGGSAVVGDIASNLNRHPELGFMVMGYLDEESEKLPLVPRLGRVEDIDEVIRNQRPDRTSHSPQWQQRTSTDAVAAGPAVVRHSDRRGLRSSGDDYRKDFRPRDLPPSQLIFSSTFDPGSADLAMKKFYSMLFGTSGNRQCAARLRRSGTVHKSLITGPVLAAPETDSTSGGAPFRSV